jgi:hypothetical protein
MGGNLTVEFSGDEAQLLRSQERIIRGQEKMIDKLRVTLNESSKTGKGMKGAFGSGALKDLKNYVTGLASVSAGIAGISSALAAVKEESNELAQSLRSREGGLKRLSQVSGSKEEYAQLENLAKQLAVGEGLSVSDAANLIFQAKSQGLLSDIAVLAKTARFTDPQAMIESVGKFKSAFGASEAGSTEQLLSKFLTAAEKSDVSVEEIARAAVISAQGASRIGATDEELLSLLSVLSPAFKSPQTASQRLQALASVLAKGFERQTGRKVRDDTGKLVPETERVSFGGQGFLAGLNKFATEFPAEFEKAILGREEAAAAYQAILTNREALGPRLGEILAAQDTLAPLERQWAITEGGTLGALREERRQRAAAEISGEQAGGEALSYETLLQQYRELYRRSGHRLTGHISEGLFGVERGLFGDEWAASRLRGQIESAREEGLLGPGSATSADAVAEGLARQGGELARQIGAAVAQATGQGYALTTSTEEE